MESRTFQLLEFPKVLSRLAEFAVSVPGRNFCLAIRPFPDAETLSHHARTSNEAMALCRETGVRLPVFEDLDGLFAHLSGGRDLVDADGLWALLDMLDKEAALRETLLTRAHGTRRPADGEAPEAYAWPLLAAMALAAPRPAKLHQALKRCVTPDAGLRDESSPELFSVRQEIRAIHQKCAKNVKEFVGEQGISAFLQDDFITISSDRYVLPLKTNFKGRVPGIVHDYSQTGETCYVEPFFLVEINNRLQELKQEEREEEAKVLAYLTGLARQEAPAASGAYDLLVKMDALFAKAAFAEALHAETADVAPGNPVRLMNARHPLLVLSRPEEATPGRAGKKASPAVTQDIVLNDDQKALIISGANAGGKTVCLKTLGLLSLMALSALPVPADEGSTLPFWKKIFVFMGDEQSLEDHLSTFTAQISHLSRLWPEVDDSALTLLDEFGAGTDPAQGAALAQAVVDGLLDKGAWMAAATHFPALKAYGLSRPGVRSACMLFDPASKKPLYRLAYDQVGASIALDVAREHGLPEDILARANKYLLLEGGDSAKVFDRLNALAVDRESQVAELRAQRAKDADKMAKLREKYERALESCIEQTRELSREIAVKWREGKMGGKQAMKALADARKSLIEEKARARAEEPDGQTNGNGTVDIARIEPGDAVYLSSFGKAGTVAEKDQKRRMLKVDLGGVRVWASLSDVRPPGQPGQPAPSGSPGRQAGASSQKTSPGSDAPSGFILDLRGLRADEAVVELAAFIDASVLRGLKNLEIIHGKGTGALRRETHEYLRTCRQVESFSLAPEDQGGDGMTMAVLK